MQYFGRLDTAAPAESKIRFRASSAYQNEAPQHRMKILQTLGLAAAVCMASFAADPADLYIAPYLQNVKPDSMTIMWETTTPVIGYVEYGLGSNLDRKVVEPEPRKIHEIVLGGLEVGGRYSYRAGWGSETLPATYFRTAPPPGTENWRMVVYGDNRSNPGTHSRNVERIRELDPAIILNSGDLVAQGSRYEQWKPQYFDPLRGVSENIPVFPCLGNHEQNAKHYYDYHSLPNENGEVYYSFDYANAHIIALNSNSRDAPFDLDSKQTRWLIDDLEKNKDATWKFVFFHHPLFRSHPTRGVTPQRWVWQRVFEEHGVDMVINGHDHYYMRSYAIGDYTAESKQGLYHLISGGGGAGTYPIVPKIHAAFRREIHHVTAIDIQDDRLVGRAVDIDGNVFDAFVIDKQAVNSPEEFISYEVYEFERDLGEAIRQTPVQVLRSGDSAELSVELEVANPFRAPLQGRLDWRSSAPWESGPAGESFPIEPGEPVRLKLHARLHGAQLYPLPIPTLELSRTNGEVAFRNNAIEFYPFRVSASKPVSAARASSTPKIDGRLGDRAWRNAETLDAFVDVQGAERPQRRVQVRMVHAEGRLYLAARIEAPEASLERGEQADEEEDRRTLRDDHIRVMLGAGESAYSFAVNARGAELDIKGDEVDWNSDFQTAASPAKDGWQAELSIPLSELNLATDHLRINIARRDVAANRICELVPTFGQSGQDHYVPQYDSDAKAVVRFAPLTLE